MRNIADKFESIACYRVESITYPFESSGASIIMALDVLEYLYEEEKRDYQNSNYSELRKNFLENFSLLNVN